MGNTFKGKYSIDDGYAGKSRLHFFHIDASLIEDDVNEDDLLDVFNEEMESHFRENIFPHTENFPEFLEWAKNELSSREKEEF